MPLELLLTVGVIVIVGAGLRKLVWDTGRVRPSQRRAVAEAEARITTVAADLGGQVRDLSRIELGTGAAFLSTDAHLEVRFEVHGSDPAALYEQMVVHLGLHVAPNGATAIGTFLEGTRVQVVPGQDHLRVSIAGSNR